MSAVPQEKIGVIGLGYVGLPLAVSFADRFDVIGYDRAVDRVKELRSGYDHTNEVESDRLESDQLEFVDSIDSLKECTFLIVTVPTPITADKLPDLTPLRSASEAIGGVLQKGQCVVYESTVYPGVTETVCLPILEKVSGLTLGEFSLGYSPERINPGDHEHTLEKIIKVVSGHDAECLERVAAVYGAVVTAGVHSAPNIMTAEASKVIENVQRDLNIALMNELSKIFTRLGLHTDEVLDAAATKWNFHRYHPGLVGGHCIGVDPYYLTKLATELDYNPDVILSGRRINDSMGRYVGKLVLRELADRGVQAKTARVLLLGVTFKENVPDMRGTLALTLYKFLDKTVESTMVWEPLISDDVLEERYEVQARTLETAGDLDAIVLVNSHDAFKELSLTDLKARMRTPVIVDAKNFFDRVEADRLGFNYVGL